MKHIKSILIPTDLSQSSRRGLVYGFALAADNQATLTIMHVANEYRAWEYFSDDCGFACHPDKMWPADRVLREATLDLNRFIEPHLDMMKKLPRVTKRIIGGAVAEQIARTADEERADLVIMSPRRDHKLRHWLAGSVTDRVTRLCPCPVLSVTEPLPSHSWRGRWATRFFGAPRQRVAALGA
jgi:nucleotide-binding universal stress UspA family protein